MITIVDYGVGNLASIGNMLKRIGADCIISSDGDVIVKATKLILPGVGAFDTCAEKIKSSGLISVLEEKVIRGKIPVLGVCVGMQLLFSGSEEGSLPGLAWVKGRIVRFNPTVGLKIPHMGWSEIRMTKTSKLSVNLYDDPRFYFVHSYHAEVENPDDALFIAHYGYDFVAGIEHENILGVQFHPEKSHKYGMRLLENFAKNF